jgi:hypothetical protein
VNFTREPIIETVITPREGCKLVVRNSKGNGQEDYFVDAIEVVSFGHSFFFRSQERPKSFLVPVSDYEILELKETRMVLKNVSSDRSIKIGGGREAPPRPREEQPPEEQEEEPFDSRPAPAPDTRPSMGKRDNNRRRRGRRGRDRQEHPQDAQQQQRPNSHPQPTRESRSELESTPPEDHLPPETQDRAAEPSADGAERNPSFISKLFPPPPTLIRDSLSRYKPQEEEKGIAEELPPLDKELEDDNEE